jgi:class 3 adenylate cyclase
LTTLPSTAAREDLASARRSFRRLPLIAALALAFASLALISGIAYIVVLSGATGTAERLLVDQAASVIDRQIAMVKSRLDPVGEQLELIAALAAAGRIEVDSPVAVREALAVMMQRVPTVSVAAFGTLDLQLHRAVRHPDGAITRDTISLTELRRGLERYRELQTSRKTFWGDLYWSESLKQPVLNVRTPVRRVDDAFIGALVATVGVGDLSALIGDPARGGDARHFILFDHDKVLAHRLLADPSRFKLTEAKPLPTIQQLGDPVLAHIWDPPVHSSPTIDRTLGALGHVVEADGHRWVFVYRQLRGYGPEPWLVGQYFPIEDATADLDKLMNGAIVGAATLAVALILALLMGFRMARSIRTITTAAEAIERLEFDQPMHKRSRLREIDDAAHSLDKARGALRWFGHYVPQRLVRRLMELGEDAIVSRRTELTVMFTDIVGFTPQAENLPEHETATLLNHHFALLGTVIEHEHGIIDKYIGDSVMAIWGPLAGSPDHAGAAIRAALAIAKVIREDNEMRRAQGKTPIRLRIGLHSGPAVVGNIGAPGRVNFTVVGDTVNVAQRFEQLGKVYMRPEEDIVVLVSGATIAAVQDRSSLGIELPPPELRRVRGHAQPVEVYRLV